jgi:serine/threonine protein kinase
MLVFIISDLFFFLSMTNIQSISSSYTIRSLLPQPYGTFIVRYPTANDELISLISIEDDSEKDTPTQRYVILTIRVDETVYKHYIQHYRLPYAEDIQGDVKQLLDAYNRRRNNSKNGKFTPLKYEFNPPRDDGSWFLDKKYLYDIDFKTDGGKHNHGTSKAIRQSEKQNDMKVFIKRFKKDNWYFKHELSLLKDLCHFSIIALHGQYSDNHNSYLVFENGGESLESLCPLKSLSSKGKMRFIANVGFQVAYAMMYLEKKNIVHRDLTAGNVLINSYGFIRVADFGHAIKKEEGTNTLEKSTTAAGENRFQFRFLAPECLPDPTAKETSNASKKITQAEVYARFSSKSDVWSFGILLIQLMLEDPTKLYPDITDTEDIPQHVKMERNIHERPKECELDMYLILERCWIFEAKDRISFTELRERMLQLETIFR